MVVLAYISIILFVRIQDWDFQHWCLPGEISDDTVLMLKMFCCVSRWKLKGDLRLMKEDQLYTEEILSVTECIPKVLPL